MGEKVRHRYNLSWGVGVVIKNTDPPCYIIQWNNMLDPIMHHDGNLKAFISCNKIWNDINNQ